MSVDPKNGHLTATENALDVGAPVTVVFVAADER
jgi:hypothetical protein